MGERTMTDEDRIVYWQGVAERALAKQHDMQREIDGLKALVASLPIDCAAAATEFLQYRGEYGWANTAEGIRAAISDAARAACASSKASPHV